MKHFNFFFKKHILSVLLFLFLVPGISVFSSNKKPTNRKNQRYQIAVCDWMILKRQKLGAFELAKEIGSDGIELDMGGLGNREQFDNKLRDSAFVDLFKQEAEKHNQQISSIAMSAFYAQSFATRQNYIDLIQDCLNTMDAMDVKVAFLPLGVQGDLSKNPEIKPELVRRLKIAGDLAHKSGKVIGIETSLDAKSEVKLLKEINSPGIKIYFNFQNPLEAGRDIYKELRVLGKKRICQIHCTDTDEVTLPYNQRLDMHKIKKTLDRMGWSGWLVVERSRDKNDPRNVKKNFSTNVNYLKDIFQK
ncbi:MAG: sugar phosphate isomerase/epimerase [Porphyromonadaceae bacterium]|jgi:sugar phosphate isomerase/epimerase|nr:sugar phosphate isomerase/epimerase [Porphyromonadaceae bacterium]